jgi:MraZ protein
MVYNVVESGVKWGKVGRKAPLLAQNESQVGRVIEQMFLGEFSNTIDNKGRLTIPSRFRPDVATGVVVTRGLDGCLVVYTNAEWELLAARVNALPITDRRARDFRRFVFGSAAEAMPDRQGRVLIPAFLREYAGIDGEVAIVGMNTYIEIWNPETWQAMRQGVEDDDANAERWAELGI